MVVGFFILFASSCQKAWDCKCSNPDSMTSVKTKIVHADEEAKAFAKCGEWQPHSICQVTPH